MIYFKLINNIGKFDTEIAAFQVALFQCNINADAFNILQQKSIGGYNSLLGKAHKGFEIWLKGSPCHTCDGLNAIVEELLIDRKK